MTDLLDEFAAAYRAFRKPHADRLIGYGVPPNAWFAAPATGVGFSKIVPHGDGTYQPDPGGPIAAIILVTGIIETGEETDYDDLLAFSPMDPSRWWLRLGRAEMLGAWEAERRGIDMFETPPALAPDIQVTDEPLAIWKTPLDWLRAGCVGVVPLRRHAWSALRRVDTPLIAMDVAHGAQIKRQLLEPVRPVPRVLVPAIERGVAA